MKRRPRDHDDRRRSLSQTGGAVRIEGDADFGARLAECLDVDADAPPMFTHAFHAYPGRMHPETARRIIAHFGGDDGLIVDPFMGSGTTAVEALRQGRRYLGGDVSPVALEITWARTRVLTPEVCREIERTGHQVATEAARHPAPTRTHSEWARRDAAWYPPHVLHDLVRLDEWIGEVRGEGIERLLRVVMSSMLVKFSRRASDSSGVMDRDHRPPPAGAAIRFFREKCSELSKLLFWLSRDIASRGILPIEPELRLEDARRFSPAEDSVDLVVTSPPYPGVYDYTDHHALRLSYFGHDPRREAEGEFASRSGMSKSHDAERSYRDGLEEILLRLEPALRPRGSLVFLIGDGFVGERLIDASRSIRDAATSCGLAVVATASQARREWSRGARGASKAEHLVLLRRS